MFRKITFAKKNEKFVPYDKYHRKLTTLRNLRTKHHRLLKSHKKLERKNEEYERILTSIANIFKNEPSIDNNDELTSQHDSTETVENTHSSNESINIEDKSTQYIETDGENNINEFIQHNTDEAIYITDDENIQPNIGGMMYNTDESKDKIKYINNPTQLVTNDENYIDESINRSIHSTDEQLQSDFTETNMNESIQSNLNFNESIQSNLNFNEPIQSDFTESCKINNYSNQQNIIELFDIHGNIYYINTQSLKC
ncbi:3003_t:CDS:1 [Acaulospora morrowiae]|uniref:3003_t:CDS:1 n=1 Tax=Acaulospora morrowiae TaxID=94023 RepID=A0A9N8YLP9_9GLOM|nr:3003_t:CDS:1 [Acaulospora morrowiae]